MLTLTYDNGVYRTAPFRPSLIGRMAPGLPFYVDLLSIVLSGSARAKRGLYADAEWCENSFDTLRALENVGVRFEVTGIDNLRKFSGPCVFIGNHMSTLETFVLPMIIEPVKHCTFVVKQSLIDYPVFKHIMRTRNPVTVGRTNARDDFRIVMEGGSERLKNGVSIIVFPQTTRSPLFDPAEFNTIGIKLAKRAGVPIVPIALLTDAWGNGKLIKDFGKIDPKRKVYFAFGEPMTIQGRGDEEHEKIIAFVDQHLKEWGGQIKS